MPALPTFDDVKAAARRLEGVTLRTPLLENARVNAALGGRLFLKAECLQRTGSFKLRGAYNFLASMSEADRARGVVGWSSGNHAQGLAEAARLLGTKATIVMPADAPALKVANTRASGAEACTLVPPSAVTIWPIVLWAGRIFMPLRSVGATTFLLP